MSITGAPSLLKQYSDNSSLEVTAAIITFL
jgi:hypothetical protein